MDHLVLAFTVVCPLILMMGLGYFLKFTRLFNERFLQELNSLCFLVFLPLLLFINVYKTDVKTIFTPKLVLFAIIGVLVCFGLLMIFIPMIEKDNKRRGVLIQGIFRSNYILFGLPVTISLFGEENAGTTAVLIAFIVPLFNMLSVIALEVFRGNRIDVKKIIIGIMKNPLVIASVFATFFVLTEIRLPQVLIKTASDIAKIATPLSLIILGGTFGFKAIFKNKKPLIIGLVGRLVLVPAFLIGTAILMGFRGVDLGAIMTLAASPTAVSSYTMAKQMDADSELAGQIVVLGSVLAIFAMFCWICFLKQAGLF